MYGATIKKKPVFSWLRKGSNVATGVFVSVLLKVCDFRGSQYREDRTVVVGVHKLPLKRVP